MLGRRSLPETKKHRCVRTPSAIQAEARNAQQREIDRQHLALLARGVVTRRVVLGADLAVREGFGLELRGFQRGAVFPSVGEGPFTPASSHG